MLVFFLFIIGIIVSNNIIIQSLKIAIFIFFYLGHKICYEIHYCVFFFYGIVWRNMTNNGLQLKL